MIVFPSTLIISRSVSSIKKQIDFFCQNLKNLHTTNNPDIITIGQSSWTINDIRQLKKFFSQKPLSHQNKIALIFYADQLGIPAQNALLKILEEPGANRYLILSTSKPQALLPTILSRCQQIHLSSKNTQTSSFIPKTSNLSQNFSLTNRLPQDKEKIPELLKKELNYQQFVLINSPSSFIAQNIKQLIRALDMIKHNVDPRTALDYYLLS